MKTINKASSNQIDNNRSRTFITGKIRELARNVVEIEAIAYFQPDTLSHAPDTFRIQKPLNLQEFIGSSCPIYVTTDGHCSSIGIGESPKRDSISTPSRSRVTGMNGGFRPTCPHHVHM